jgi:hypothetical protein
VGINSLNPKPLPRRKWNDAAGRVCPSQQASGLGAASTCSDDEGVFRVGRCLVYQSVSVALGCGVWVLVGCMERTCAYIVAAKHDSRNGESLQGAEGHAVLYFDHRMMARTVTLLVLVSVSTPGLTLTLLNVRNSGTLELWNSELGIWLGHHLGHGPRHSGLCEFIHRVS